MGFAESLVPTFYCDWADSSGGETQSRDIFWLCIVNMYMLDDK